MPSGPTSAKSKRSCGNIKETIKKQGRSDALAEQIVVQTVDRRRTPREPDESPREEAGMSDTAQASRRAVDEARGCKR